MISIDWLKGKGEEVKASPHSLGPQELVETGVDSNVGGGHLLLGELAHLLDGAGSTALEAAAIQ
jgi:hypothetical protein